MDTLEVSLGARSYPIHIGPGLLADAALLGEAVKAKQILVVTNDTVAPLYLPRLQSIFAAAQLEVYSLPDGEQYKSLQSFAAIIDALIARQFHRDACLIALGGGVVGDIGGFAAASYQRGIDYVQIPTTLLAQVDSSVGGKTAINHARAKNMVGAFYQPRCVIADTDTLATLAPRQLSAGLAEVIKYGVILDAAFFDWLEAHVDDMLALDDDALRVAVRRSCELKAAIVAEDEREHGRRALLNLGHTFGHALESIGGYSRWLHGEAVAIGIALAAKTSAALGWIGDADVRRVVALLERARLPTHAAVVDATELLETMRLDKKASAAGLKVVLIRSIGNAAVVQAPDEDVLHAVLEAELAA
jgi:3-dehydroquinate synthase